MKDSRKRSLFYKKAPQKIFDGWCAWHGSRQAATWPTPVAPGAEVFCGAFFQKSDLSLGFS
jgi:hypothetical protein